MPSRIFAGDALYFGRFELARIPSEANCNKLATIRIQIVLHKNRQAVAAFYDTSVLLILASRNLAPNPGDV